MSENITTFWELIKEYKIIIPIIQRDYAQGRMNEKVRRDEFLKVIYTALTEPRNLNLDFVYGRVDYKATEKIFSPIDGQQRLTTLFLLHWYIAKKENISAEELGVLKRFSYNTRISSREFCEALIAYGDKLPEIGKLKNSIVNCSWYRKAWDTDQTIQSMLTMLESVHEKFYGTDNLWDTLKTNITFQLLDLGEKGFELTDELYIKMNARGKQLTKFENFKAWFIAFLEKNHKWSIDTGSRTLTASNYFSCQIEGAWTDLFWLYRDKDTHTIDDRFMNFFIFIAKMCYFKVNLDKDAKNFNADDFSLLEGIFSEKEQVDLLFDALNWFYNLSFDGNVSGKEKIAAFFASFLGKGKINLFETGETDLFDKCISEGNFDPRNTIILYCIIHYTLKYGLNYTANDGLKYESVHLNIDKAVF
jgi:hypothetical protein